MYPTVPCQLSCTTSLSTDFPKWETETATDPLLKWSNSQSLSRKDGSSGLEDCIRRSDLLFAYNPNVDPYRFDKARIRRIESRIQFEAKFLLCENRTTVSQASERLWFWLCTFQDVKTQKARYVTSVKGIVESLPPNLVLMLAMMPTTSGRSVLDDAHPMCADVIRWRLKDHPKDSDPTIPMSITAKSSLSSSLNAPSYPMKALRHAGKEYALEESVVKTLKAPFGGKNCIGFLCRTLFNVAETSVPTSFIILPYKLSRSEDGRLGMESSDSAPTAVKFAECLINLTDPRSIIYHMNEKSVKYYNVSLYDQVDDEKSLRHEAFEKVKEFENTLLKLYEPGVAYLYLLDEETGVPVVPPKGEDKYPIVINEPVNMVRKLIGLMLIGMVQMRGEKAMSVLCTVLADPNITVLPVNWIENSQGTESSSTAPTL